MILKNISIKYLHYKAKSKNTLSVILHLKNILAYLMHTQVWKVKVDTNKVIIYKSV